MALALAAGTGTSAAFASSTHRHPTGTIAGRVVDWNSARTATVKVFNATGRLLAHREARASDDHFRFVVTPGRYKVTLEAGGDECGHYIKTVRVRANETTRGNLTEVCANSY
jgi:hypothetical protein